MDEVERAARALRELCYSDVEAALPRLGDPDAVAYFRAAVERMRGDPAAEAPLTRLVDTGSPFAARAAVELGWLERGRGRLAEAERWFVRAVAFAEARDDAELRVACTCPLAELVALRGGHARADGLLDEVEALAGPATRPRLRIARAHVARSSGRYDDVDRACTAVLRDRDVERGARFEALRLLAEARAATGDTTAALEHARAAERLLGEVSPPPRLAGLSQLFHGEMARAAGRLDEAVDAYTGAERWFPAGDVQRQYARLNRALSEIERGRPEDAAALAEPLRTTLAGRPIAAAVAALCTVPEAARRGGADLDARIAEAVGGDLADRDLARVAGHCADALGSDLPRAARLAIEAVGVWTRLGNAAERERAVSRVRGLRARGAPVLLGPWVLERRIGAGGVGQVWGARHADTGGVAAVKVLRGGLAAQVEQRVQFLRELRATARLDHPHVLALYDQGRVDPGAAAAEPTLVGDAPWLAFEFCGGGTLADRAGTLPWSEVLRLAREVLSALAHVHAHGLQHLDVKPENVLLDGDPAAPTAHLADFGLARAASSDRQSRASGTPAYMAPEQRTGDASLLGPWTDLYAFGGLLTALVTGAPPFGDTGTRSTGGQNTGARVLRTTVPVPGGLEEVLGTLLAHSRETRFRRAADVADALAALGPPDQPAGRHLDVYRRADTVDLGAPGLPELVGATAGFDVEAVTRPPTRRPGVRTGGVSLLGLRAPRTVGRRRERAVTWNAWLDVYTTGRPRSVVVSGPPGSGCRHLVEELAVRAGEEGAVVVRRGPEDDLDLDRLLGALDDGPAVMAVAHPHRADPDDRLRRALADRPVLWLAAVPDDVRRDWGPGVTELRLGPFAEVPALLDGWVTLAPALRDAVVAAAAGNPGRAVALVRRLAADRRLTHTPEGYALRPGADLRDGEPALPPVARAALAWMRSAGGRVDLAALDERLGAGARALVDRLVREGRLRLDGAFATAVS